MGCMMNSMGVGSGKDMGDYNEEDTYVDRVWNHALSFNTKGIIRGWTVFLLWGKYGCSKLNTPEWKKFVNDARQTIYDLPPKYPPNDRQE